MTQGTRNWSIATRTFIIAGGASLGTLAGALFRECWYRDRGECSFSSYTLWVSWLASFFAVWAGIGALSWIIERDRQKRQH